MDSLFWNRRIEILSGGREWIFPTLNMTFTINFDSDTIPDETDLSIFNLSDDSIANIKSGQDLVINAGYGTDLGNVFAGVIQYASLEQNGVDRELKIHAINVSDNYLSTTINYTYGAGVTSEHLIRDILGYVGIIPNVVNLASPQTYQLGFCANGKIIDIVRRIANDADSKVINRNGSLYIVADYSGAEDIEWQANAKNGLVDIKPIDDASTPAKYTIKTLLNHAIQPYVLFNIDSTTFQGTAIAMEGSHVCGGLSGDFYTETKIIPI